MFNTGCQKKMEESIFTIYIDNIIKATQISIYLILFNQAFQSQSNIILMQAKSNTISTISGKYWIALANISLASINNSFHHSKLYSLIHGKFNHSTYGLSRVSANVILNMNSTYIMKLIIFFIL